MTCIERLRELHPEYSEEDIREACTFNCPGAFDIADDPDWCDIFDAQTCIRCWNREVEEQKSIVSEPLDHLFPLREVRFNELEEAVIREMSHKLGQPREDIVRMAVREMWSRFRE